MGHLIQPWTAGMRCGSHLLLLTGMSSSCCTTLVCKLKTPRDHCCGTGSGVVQPVLLQCIDLPCHLSCCLASVQIELSVAGSFSLAVSLHVCQNPLRWPQGSDSHSARYPSLALSSEAGEQCRGNLRCSALMKFSNGEGVPLR